MFFFWLKIHIQSQDDMRQTLSNSQSSLERAGSLNYNEFIRECYL